MATDVVSETVLENRLPCGHGAAATARLSGRQILKLCVYGITYGVMGAPKRVMSKTLTGGGRGRRKMCRRSIEDSDS